jgi:glycosyltransferase involved in cell wall biosynthesis
MDPKISVVIPVLNEARNLPHLDLPTGLHEVVLVDGRSTDRTVVVAVQLWPDGVIITQTRHGKGNAVVCGFTAATGDIIVMMDADGSTDPGEIPAYVGALLAGADYVKGSRTVLGGGSTDFTLVRRLGNRGLTMVVNFLFGTRYTDLCYGYNAFWRRSLELLNLPDPALTGPQWGDGFEIETLMNIRAVSVGLNVREVGSYEHSRLHGESNLRAVRDGLRVLWVIVREFARKVRSKVSLKAVVGVACLAAAFLGVWILWW